MWFSDKDNSIECRPALPGLSVAGTLLALTMGVRVLRIILLAGGVLGLLALVYHLGAGSIASALTRITWWQFLLICLVHGVSVAAVRSFPAEEYLTIPDADIHVDKLSVLEQLDHSIHSA